MRISIIVAMACNRVIGAEGQLPWQLPGELQRFKQLTMGQSVLMGRKTYESLGRSLSGRQMIVLSRNPGFQAAGCRVVANLPEGISVAENDELFICGGGEIYRQTLPLVDRIYLTELQRDIAGDTYFPELKEDQFHRIRTLTLFEVQENYRFSILQRIR